MVLEEADRSLHDAICVIRCLVRKRALIAGGGAPEIEVALKLSALANKLEGIDAICTRAYANALEIIPFTLAENAGLNPIQVRKLVKLHSSVTFCWGLISLLKCSDIKKNIQNAVSIREASDAVCFGVTSRFFVPDRYRTEEPSRQG